MNAERHPSEQLASRFARYVVGWTRESQPKYQDGEILEQAAYLASLATTEGHVCAPIGDLSVRFPELSTLAEIS